MYKRIIIKISGEILNNNNNHTIYFDDLKNFVYEVKEIVKLFNIQICIVVGGGNIFRGSELYKIGINKNICDYIGMLSTIMNGLILEDYLNKKNIKSYLMSSIQISKICDFYNYKKAIDLLNKNNILILTAGIGNTSFTTDSAACLYGIELEAEAIFKATKVNGVFCSDPKKNKHAVFYEKLKYKDIINRKLKVIDYTACILASQKKLPIYIFNMYKKMAIKNILTGKKEGTLIN